MLITKIFDWIKTHVWQSVLIGLALFFLPLIIVHIAYKIPAVSPWFSTTWNSGELITYIAGFEAFIGTVFVGAVAIKQNENLMETERLRDKPKIGIKSYSFDIEKLYGISNPVAGIFFNDIDGSTSGIEDNSTKLLLKLTLKNIAQVCSIITFVSADIKSDHKTVFRLSSVDSKSNNPLNTIFLSPFDEMEMIFMFPTKVMIFDPPGTKIIINMQTSNTLGDTYNDKLTFAMNLEGDFILSH